jgi:hypothetical protein
VQLAVNTEKTSVVSNHTLHQETDCPAPLIVRYVKKTLVVRTCPPYAMLQRVIAQKPSRLCKDNQTKVELVERLARPSSEGEVLISHRDLLVATYLQYETVHEADTVPLQTANTSQSS